MIKLTFLGTASAVPNQDHQNTHLIFEVQDRTVLVDCVGNPVVRLEQAAIDPLSISDLIITHFHPDHVSGVPLLLMDLWLMGRDTPLFVYGLTSVIERIEKMMALYEWENWDGFYPVHFVRLPIHDQMILIDQEKLNITSAPTCHMVPSMGIRIQIPQGAVTYSSDTSPCDSLLKLAEGSDILIHEATGAGNGHTSPEQAGHIAQKAGVDKLYLIHYPPDCDIAEWVARAQRNFSGKVAAAQDLMVINFP